jgi:hypothetical protein
MVLNQLRETTPMTKRVVAIGLVLMFMIVGMLGGLAASGPADPGPAVRWRQHDIRRPRPPVAEPASGPATPQPAPKDAVVLFDGASIDAWETPEGKPAGWSVKGGVLEVVPGAGTIQTRAKFGDVQLHAEFAAPDPPAGVSQDRGNSGIFLMGQFELQVLDSYRADTYADGLAGALYGQYPPLANATRPPGQWQTYDVAFRRPRFDKDGTLREPARMTVFLNGILVQNNEQFWGQTSWLEPVPYDPKVDRGPIQLQDHGHPVRFRNIWLRNLPERAEPAVENLKRPETVTLAPEVLDAYAGSYELGPELDALRVKIARDGGHLIMTLPFRPLSLRLDPISATEFVMPRTDAGLRFTQDPQGKVTGLLLRVADGERRLNRKPS